MRVCVSSQRSCMETNCVTGSKGKEGGHRGGVGEEVGGGADVVGHVEQEAVNLNNFPPEFRLHRFNHIFLMIQIRSCIHDVFKT